jgi:hypothetical protein
MGKITTIRRIVQVVSFFLLVYISILSLNQVNTKYVPFIEPPEGIERPDWYDPPAEYTEIFDTYLPAMSCRFISGQTRLFRACFLHFAIEAIYWKSPLVQVMFHVLVFVILSFILGRFMCGWICPMGFMGEFFSLIRARMGISKIELPRKLINIFSNFKYFLISLMFLITIAITIPILGMGLVNTELSIIGCAVCPARILFPLITGGPIGQFSLETPIYAVLAVIGFSFLLLYFFGIFSRYRR